ncbi:MAG TPA: DNA replication/repair protein RecF [Bacteroidia bacterium]|nr:DNA replication/repair protein RecF [Bacteroidia bacterium]HMU18382.1 DNA replication/repair protein RecF [Bacteroidia bacterium]
MYLSHLSLVNFKNYTEAQLNFSSGVNCITGTNGSGKTNIIDAIYYLSFTKSYFNISDTQNIQHGESLFVIQGKFSDNEKEEHVFCGVKTGFKKQFKRGGEEYERLSDHIGLFPVVMVAPVDHILITEGSDERRKFIDSIISQVDKIYLENLISYNKTLTHRNSYLKQLHGRIPDTSMMEVWDEQLVKYGCAIESERRKFIAEFIQLFNETYYYLADHAEEVSINYQTQLEQDDFGTQLKSSLQKDIALQHTSTGIHKDELVFKLGKYPLKRIASQGQQKTFLMAIKIAQFEYLFRHKKTKPILLLDDIFDKLDDFRAKRLMELVSRHTFGQIFITDTHPERLKKIFDDIKISIRLFEVNKGTVKETT